jgi:hypothetical protein
MPEHPAAYARDAADRQALLQAAAQRGWPVPVIYAADARPAECHAPAADQLEVAIAAGKHDALLMPLPGTLGDDPDRLMRLLSSCTRSGVAVSFTPTNAVCRTPGEPHPAPGSTAPAPAG